MADTPAPTVSASHSFAAIWQNPQRTILGVIYAALAIGLAFGMIDTEHAALAVAFLQGVHYFVS